MNAARQWATQGFLCIRVDLAGVGESPAELTERHFDNHRPEEARAVITYELRAGSPQLLVHVALDWHHEEHLLSMVFPLDVRSDTAMCDIQFGVVGRPTHPSSPWDAAKFEVCAHRFVDVSEPDFGVAVLNDGRYGHSVFDEAIRVSLARAAKYPDPNADRGHHEVEEGRARAEPGPALLVDPEAHRGGDRGGAAEPLPFDYQRAGMQMPDAAGSKSRL